MEDPSIHLVVLLEKKEWSTEEIQWFLDYLEHSDGMELKQTMQLGFSDQLQHGKMLAPEISERMLKVIHEKTAIAVAEKNNRRIFPITRLMVAATVISVLMLTAYLILKNNFSKLKSEVATIHSVYKNDIYPGSDKAILTLSNGKRILLDTAENESVIQEAGAEINKLKGEIAYNHASPKEILYNTITTPNGGQYQVVLPDGSHVWLNAASSIYFPTYFTGSERRVSITGEAYFEVQKNASMPFIVMADGSEIHVLGTHFNVMTYNDEAAIKTTLLEGAIEFVKGIETVKLLPGQQLQLAKVDGTIKVIDDVNTGEVIAWKNELFDFEGTDVATIMRQLARWYDAEIIFDHSPDDLFYATIPRATKLSDVLQALELTGKVKFEIEGRKIRVME